jgi:hypothetical protein
MKSCLLIIQRSFYSFEKQITDVLIAKGYHVVAANDEYPANNFGKILGKLHIPILLPITEAVITKNHLTNKKYDLVLIFKGRGIGKSLIQKINNVSERVIGFNWDSFKFNKAPLRWYKYTNKYCTFDYLDAARYSLPLIELFTSIKERSDHTDKKYDISVLMRNHSGRLRYINKVLSTLKQKEVFIFIYELNIFYFLINFMRSPSLYLKYRKYISYKSLSYFEYITLLSQSKFTVDYAHPYQTGITMRCFEAISSETKIITNNPYAEHCKYLNKLNCLVFQEDESPSLLIDRFNEVKNVPAIFRIRTITEFIDELLS